jgi:hypothetical protein
MLSGNALSGPIDEIGLAHSPEAGNTSSEPAFIGEWGAITNEKDSPVSAASPRHLRAEARSILKAAMRILWKFRSRFQVFATSTALEYLVMGSIASNTLLMAIDADCDFCDQSTCAGQKAAMEFFNVVFTVIFSFESVVKLVGFGWWRYLVLMRPMSWLDVIIVGTSLAETQSVLATTACFSRSAPCEQYDECEVGGGTSVFRIVRLARIVKLLSRFTSLQKQIIAIVKTAKSVSSLLFLIFIFIAIFLILGMTLMGGLVVQPWAASNLIRGMRVFVRVPGDSLVKTPFSVLGRPAILKRSDTLNHSGSPWYELFACSEGKYQDIWSKMLNWSTIMQLFILGLR